MATLAQVIANQINANKISAMTGALAIATEKGLKFSLIKKSPLKVTTFCIDYNRRSDSYDVTAYNKKGELVFSGLDYYDEMLKGVFQQATGLFASL